MERQSEIERERCHTSKINNCHTVGRLGGFEQVTGSAKQMCLWGSSRRKGSKGVIRPNTEFIYVC